MIRPIPPRTFGSTGTQVTCVGLGGEGVLRTYGQEQPAWAVIREALARGITYFDSARAYAGSESYYGLVWSETPADRAEIFQASKSAARDKKNALLDLDRTFHFMNIDHLDLWQIHDVGTEEDLRSITAPGGALEAFEEAKAYGKVSFIGVTGHHNPKILTRAVREWPVDSVMMPVNPVESILGGFLDTTLTVARDKGIAVIGMKVLGGSHYLTPESGVTAELLIRFALSYPITTAIVGCSTPEHVRVLADSAREFPPLSERERNDILELFRPYAESLAYYRGTL